MSDVEMDPAWEERVLADPWGVIVEALAYAARGEQRPDDLEEAVTCASVMLCASTLVQAGGDPEVVARQFDERDFQIHLGYDPATDLIDLSIQWDDGETTPIPAPAP